jgi:hypothetical protein
VTEAPTRRLVLWFGLLAAPVAWTWQLWLGYGAAEAACAPGTRGGPLGGSSTPAILVVTAAAGVLALLGLLTAVHARRQLGDVDRSTTAGGRAAFMAAGGIAVSALFLVLILLGAVPLLALDPCDGV